MIQYYTQDDFHYCHAGEVPESLGRVPSLLFIRLDNNGLTGSLKPYADALARNAAESSLLVLDVSNNQLDGPIPAGLAAAPMMDPTTVANTRQG
jgi:hypothetical protein